MKKNNFLELKIAWLPIIGIIIAIAGLGVATYNLHYSTSGTREASKWEAVFYANKKEAVVDTKQHWAKGKISYGLYHYKGPAKTKYTSFFRKNNGAYVKHFAGSLAKNNKYYGDYYMHTADGKSKYSYKLLKQSNLKNESRIKIEFARK